jgi:phosphopantetheinyl transferase
VIFLSLAFGETSLDAASVLSSQEAALLGPRASSKRRSDFLRGRLVAKKLLSSIHPGSSIRDFIVLPNDGGVPLPFDLSLNALPYSLTISHTQGIALAGLTRLPTRLGADVERTIERPEIVVDDYFTALERALVNQGSLEQQRTLATCIWALKEAALKATGDGLRRSTQTIEVHKISPTSSFSPALIRCDDGTPLRAAIRLIPQGAVAVCIISQQSAQEPLPLSESEIFLS